MKQRISDDVKVALKAGDKIRVSALRLIMAAIKQQEVDTRQELSTEEIMRILHKMGKQRRESITQYQQAGRDDLREREQFELDIINAYLPERMGAAETDTLIQQAIEESGATSIQDIGTVMARLKNKLQGRADMGSVSKKVKEKLSA